MFYQTTPFKPTPILLVQGTPQYLFGSFATDVAPTRGIVLSDSGNGATSTVTFKLIEGNIPKVDSLVTIVGSANSAGQYNVTNAAILSVSAAANPDMGIFTITFLGSGSSATATDSGQLIIPQSEIGDALTTTGASAPVVSPVAGPNSLGKSLSVSVKLPASTTANPSTLSGVTVVIQGANVDLDSEYATIGTVVTGGSAGNSYEWQSGQAVGAAAPGSVSSGSVNEVNFRFYRLNATAVTGTGPIIGKLLQ